MVLILLCLAAQDVYTQQNVCMRIFMQLDDKFFDALREVESEGDICKMSTDHKLGPYQISEDYYRESVEANPTLRLGGRPTDQSYLHIHLYILWDI